MPEPELPEIVTESPRLSAARTSVHRARGAEMAAVWGLLGILACAGVGYAIREAVRDQPAAPRPVASVAPEPGPIAAPSPPRRPVPARRKSVVDPRPEHPPTVVEKVVEKTAEAPRKMVDPLEGFDSGEAFDNPPSPGKYGRRSSGLAPPR